MKVRVGAATDVGRARERNEDSLLAAPPLYAVADGMGGHRGGNVASQLALTVLARLGDGSWDRLADQVREANRAILERSRGDRSLSGMGTTITAAFMEGDDVHLAHVGDSRAYLFRDGELHRLTEDHTLVHRMALEGKITEAEEENHPQRSILIRALGVEEPVEVDEVPVRVVPGDRVLLCSDGLHSMVGEEEIEEIFRTASDPQEAAERLVESANRAGGLDNVTVVVLDFEAGDGVELADRAIRDSVIADEPSGPDGTGTREAVGRHGGRSPRGGPHPGPSDPRRPPGRHRGDADAGRDDDRAAAGAHAGAAAGHLCTVRPPQTAAAAGDLAGVPGRALGHGVRGASAVSGPAVVRGGGGRPRRRVQGDPVGAGRDQAVRAGAGHGPRRPDGRAASPAVAGPSRGDHRGQPGQGGGDCGEHAVRASQAVTWRGGGEEHHRMIQAQTAASAAPPVRARSGVQLALTILAALLAILAYALVVMGKHQRLSVRLPVYVVLFFGTYVAMHLLIRRLAPHADPAFFPVAGVLVGFGFAMLYRLNKDLSVQ